jgi:hypothetical protein
MADLDFWGWIDVFSYIINLWVIAVPWTVIGFGMILVNVFVNIDFNRGWAQGNVYLMWNTIYALL